MISFLYLASPSVHFFEPLSRRLSLFSQSLSKTELDLSFKRKPVLERLRPVTVSAVSHGLSLDVNFVLSVVKCLLFLSLPSYALLKVKRVSLTGFDHFLGSQLSPFCLLLSLYFISFKFADPVL